MNYNVFMIGEKDNNSKQKLEELFDFPITLVDENGRLKLQMDEEAYFDACIKGILCSDFIVVKLSEQMPFQVGAELMLAKLYKLPVYVICEKTEYMAAQMAFWDELCTRVFRNEREMAEYLNQLYKYERLNIYQDKLDWKDILAKLKAFDAGYDIGYSESEGFWGEQPAHFVQVAAKMLAERKNVRCLDLGCGTGKNSVFLSKKNFSVTAYDSSYYAIMEATNLSKDVNWKIRDIRKCHFPSKEYDLVIMTGLLHCLSTEDEVRRVVEQAQEATKPNGYHVVSVFNDDIQDLSGHSESFHPILLPHQTYVDLYRDWKIVACSNSILNDVHPNNGIKHKHSITRILVQRTMA